jgi:hypothetical protein
VFTVKEKNLNSRRLAVGCRAESPAYPAEKAGNWFLVFIFAHYKY